MNTKSIRFRLTLWYSLAFFVGTAVMFVIFYLVTKQTLLLQTDQELTVHADALVKIIGNGQSNMMTGIFNQGVISQQFSEMPGMLVVITDSFGKITANSQQGAESDPVIKELLQKSSMVIKPIFVDRAIGSSILRIGVFPIINNGNVVGLVLMGDPVEAIYRSLNSLLISLLIVNLLFFIPALIGGHLLARKAMEPVSDMSRKLAKITSDNLNERVDVPKTSDELEELAKTFNNLFDRLAQAFSRERQFIGDVAHELKTPLTTQRSNIEVILTKGRDKNEYVRALNENLVDNNRMSATLDNILDLARSKAEIAKINHETFNFSELLEEIREVAVKMSLPKHITVKTDIEPYIKLYGEKDKLFHAVLNIIDNAIKYNNINGSISILLHKTPTKIHLSIKDSGIGIAKNDLQHIFERFFRGTQTGKITGSGLGLAISQAIVFAHHGQIKVESRISQGTTVNIFFPTNQYIK